MDWIDEVYEWCGDGMEQNGRYTRAFLSGFFRAVGAAGYYADSGLIGSAKGKRYSEEYNDAAIAFELDIDEVERRHETPDPDFPDFVADLPE
ncbi:MAG: hypothetical protein SVV03_03905, partial [Candidatus Nanohaloarchaea archaeon]|nr:hypothetical protein [Candidatus Nanohaloarchaea archaeon]